jgi:hypothetical protein
MDWISFYKGLKRMRWTCLIFSSFLSGEDKMFIPLEGAEFKLQSWKQRPLGPQTLDL